MKPELSIIKRDQYLETIHQALEKKKKLLLKKANQLSDRVHDNEYLRPIEEQYQSYSKSKHKEQQDQMDILQKLHDSLEELTRMSSHSHWLENIRHDQQLILEELKKFQG